MVMLPVSRAASESGYTAVKKISRSICISNGRLSAASSSRLNDPKFRRIVKLRQAEQYVAVGLELGSEPGADTDRIEELDHWNVVATGLAAISEKLFTLIRRQQGHGGLGGFAHGSCSVTGGRKRAHRPPGPSRRKAPPSWL
ncbi:hypothetical protein AJ88_23440 [Mesorhizobium amorphae CCBAU 01583]|nr:hypothetical protein AJ88_23440 [Mesorhizobium amorphae CCBAU 01583]